MSSIRIVIGGPRHSGKSTFSACLVHSLVKRVAVSAYHFCLDPYDRSGDVLWNRILDVDRKKDADKVDKKFMQNLAKEFIESFKKYDIVIGDLPGLPYDLTEIVAAAGTYGIIVCREDELGKIDEWKKMFSKNDVKLIAIVHTSEKDGNENTWLDSDLIMAELTGLDKKIRLIPAVTSFASLLKSKLGI